MYQVHQMYSPLYPKLYGDAVATLAQQASNIIRQAGGFELYPLDNLSNLFVNSNGTTPVVNTGDSIGYVGDVAYGGQLGAELITNGDFSNGSTGWTDTSINGGSVNFTGGQVILTTVNPGIGGRIEQTFSTVAGKSYRLTVDRVSGASIIQLNAGNIYQSNFGTGLISIVFVATSTITLLTALRFNAGIATVDNISVREVLGFHALQATAANKPLMTRFSRNLLRWTESFDNVYWYKDGLGVTANTAVAPDGTLSADTLTRWATTSYQAMVRATTNQIPNTTYTLSIYAKASTANCFLLFRNLAVDAGVSNGLVRFNLQNGTIDLTFGSLYADKCSMTLEDNGYYRCSITGTTPSSITHNLIDIGLTSSGVFGGDAGDNIFIWGANLTQSSSALPYEPADLYPRSGTPLLQFDGSNDFLTVSAPPAITTQATIVWAGSVANLSANRVIISGNTSGRFAVEITTVGVANVYGSGGTIVASSSGGFVTADNAVYSIRATSNTIQFYRNGTLIDTVNGSFSFNAVTTMNICSGSTGGANYNGQIAYYSVTPTALTDAQRQLLERRAGSRIGVTL